MPLPALRSGSELEGVVERELMSSTCQPGGLKLKEIVGDLGEEEVRTLVCGLSS